MATSKTKGSQKMINQIYNEDCLETMNRIDDKSINLIIADFPYFEVKGDFDFIWKDFNEFLEWVEVCAKEFKRILSDNGSLYVYGDAKKIAYKQIIFDKYFNLENNLVWENTNPHKQQVIFSGELRSYGKITERILFYSNEVEETGLQTISNDLGLYKPIRDYFKEQREKINDISYNDINKLCFGTASNGGGMASNILTSYKKGWTFPTKELYEKLQTLNICLKPYEELRKEYEDLRKEYEYLRRPFDNKDNHGEIFKIPNYETKEYSHPTVKPRILSKALIEISSRENDLVYIPFGGSGTEPEQCHLLNRKYIGSELEPKYCEIIEHRIKNAKGEVGLFSADLVQGSLF